MRRVCDSHRRRAAVPPCRRRYLPPCTLPLSCGAPSPERCGRLSTGCECGADYDLRLVQEALAAEELAQQLSSQLEHAQWPAVWDPARIMHVSLNDTSGFGVTVHLLAQALAKALRHNMTMVVDGKFSYFRHSGCTTPARRPDLSVASCRIARGAASSRALARSLARWHRRALEALLRLPLLCRQLCSCRARAPRLSCAADLLRHLCCPCRSACSRVCTARAHQSF